MAVIIEPAFFIVPLPLKANRLTRTAANVLYRRPIIRLALPLNVAVSSHELHRCTNRIRDEGAERLALLGLINTQQGHKTTRLVDDGRALTIAFFPHDAVAVPAVVGVGSSAVGVAHGLADPAAQAIVAVGGLRGMAVGAGVGDTAAQSSGCACHFVSPLTATSCMGVPSASVTKALNIWPG